MNIKDDYNKLMYSQIANLSSDKKPRLLLHVCCGPCSTIPLEILRCSFDITLFFYNPNIYPNFEYKRRFEELKQYLIKRQYDDIKIIQIEQPYDDFIKDLIPFKEQKEGQERCQICFRKRLEKGFSFAQNEEYDFFSTVMSISRFKNSQILNEIGKQLEEKYPPVKWLFNDFKKEGRYEKSKAIIKEYNLYFQQYCGCEFSLINRNKKY